MIKTKNLGFLGLIAILILAGCQGSTSEADSLFEDGKYEEAIEMYDQQIESGGGLEVKYNRARC